MLSGFGDAEAGPGEESVWGERRLIWGGLVCVDLAGWMDVCF